MCSERQEEEEKVHREDLTIYPATHGIAGEERRGKRELTCVLQPFFLCAFSVERRTSVVFAFV